MTLILPRPRYQRTPIGRTADPTGVLNTNLQLLQRTAYTPGDIEFVTVSYQAVGTDGLVLASATGGALTVTLPAVGANAGQALTVKKIDSSAHAVTIGGTVDGAANPTLASQYQSMTVMSDGTNWWKIAAV